MIGNCKKYSVSRSMPHSDKYWFYREARVAQYFKQHKLVMWWMTKTFSPPPPDLKVYDMDDTTCIVCAESNSKLILNCGHTLCIYCYQTIHMQNEQPGCSVCKQQLSQVYCNLQTIRLVSIEYRRGKIAGVLKSSTL